MRSGSERIRQTILQEYGLEVCDIHKMTTGVGGDTFLINARQGSYIYKIVDVNDMNHPEEEPDICSFLFQRGLEVSVFLKNKSGDFVVSFEGKRVSHIQKYMEGKVFGMNKAADWFMMQRFCEIFECYRNMRRMLYIWKRNCWIMYQKYLGFRMGI